MTNPTRAKPEFLLSLDEHTEYQKHLSLLGDVLSELVAYGTQVVDWQTSINADSETCYQYRAKYLLTLHFIEQVDALSALARAGVSNPCKVILRAMFEAYLSIAYLYQSDSNRRGKAYIVCNAQDNLACYRDNNPATDKGKRYIKMIKAGGLGGKQVIGAITECCG